MSKLISWVGRVTRRGLIDNLIRAGLAALAGTVLYPLLRYLIPPKIKEVAAGSIIAAKVGEVAPNSGKIFLFGGKPAILVHTQQDTYRAFTAVCTHLACTVQYRPLTEFSVAVKGNEIVVTRAA